MTKILYIELKKLMIFYLLDTSRTQLRLCLTLELLGPNLNTTVLLPFTLACGPTVDLAAGRIVADPPEGLFPDDTPEQERQGDG